MAEEWAPKAINASEQGLESIPAGPPPEFNCASLIASKLGASESESTMVAGFAGGIGLSGKGCGALAAAIWMITLRWMREHPNKEAPMFRFPEVSKLIEDFKTYTGGVVRCEGITGRKFPSPEAHSDYIANGGCELLLNWLAENSARPNH
jgi:hypothetical protein